MKRQNLTRLGMLSSVIGLALVPASALALQSTAGSSTSAASSARLKLIITRGDNEIS